MAKKPVSSVLSDDMKQNIQSYGSEIKTLEDFVTVVRQNPGYQLGSIGNKGVKNMAREIWQNSFDEMDKASSPCSWVMITFDERVCGFTCEDNGRGIPLGDILRIFMDPNTSSNYTKKPGEYSSGLHGVGAKVTNAMSHKFIIESYKFNGDARRVEFTEGYPWDKGEVQIPNPEKKQGTKIYFEPSVEGLGEINISWKDVYKWLTNITPLNAVGDVVYFKAIDMAGKVYEETLINTDGIYTYLIRDTDTPLIKPIDLHKDTGQMKFDIAVTWDTSESATNHIIAFANKCPTVFGTHIDGFEDGVCTFFVNYMNKIFLANQKKKLTIVKNDIKCGLKAIISAAHLVPIFDGQSKERLSNAEMEPFVKQSVMELLDIWAKNNPKDLAIICKYFKDMAEIRTSADKQRVRLTDKYSKSKLTGLPSKFVAPTEKRKDNEFFITEGDSAGGLMRNNRINKRQGYFPIRGKLPNAFRTERKKFLANAEVAGIIQIIGGGYGRDFDISKVKWDKIIFATDADKDGNHIRALLLRFFILYMPQLIEAGKVYAAIPPLYGVRVGKGKYIYLKDRMEYIKYVQKEFSKNNTIYAPGAKSAITGRELSKLLYLNIDYNVELSRVAANHAIDPILLEYILVLHYNNMSFGKFQAAIKKRFRFIDTIEKKNNMIVITGLVGNKYQTVFLNDMLIGESKIVLDLIAQNQFMDYKVNDEMLSIYEIMDRFNKSAPKTIERYKGLGEMDGKRLFNSTLDPENRTLIQYTMDSVKDEIETIQYYENDMSRLLHDVKVTRFDVMD